MVDETQDFVEKPETNKRVGELLRDARESAGKRVEDIANDTRVPLRHLIAIENSDYAALPGKTYAMGFVRAYARTVGLDEADLIAKLRAELGADDYRAGHQYEAYEPADPARVPPQTLVWTTLIVAALFAGGYWYWRSTSVDNVASDVAAEQALETSVEESAPATAAPAATAATPTIPDNAEVVVTAKDTVWFRIDDASGKQVYSAELKAGDRYVVPAGQKGLMIRTSRPQSLDLSVAGQIVPQLGPADLLVKNVSLDPAELAKRLTGANAAAAPATSSGTTAPAAGAARRAAPAREIFPATTTAED